jgi:hypothetical protein
MFCQADNQWVSFTFKNNCYKYKCKIILKWHSHIKYIMISIDEEIKKDREQNKGKYQQRGSRQEVIVLLISGWGLS